MLLRTYTLATRLLLPFLSVYMAYRKKHGKEDHHRYGERLGYASKQRPEGKLIWFHGASVGETISILSLIALLKEKHKNVSILLTSGTVTSAKLITKKNDRDIIHQYIPIDHIDYVKRFLDHWHPDLAVWLESELWPNLLLETKRRGIKAALINARMSSTSFNRWQHAKSAIHELMGTFNLCLAQSEEEKTRFIALGSSDVRYLGNLKYAAAAPTCDPKALAAFAAQVGSRSVWVATSTHKGEEEIIAQIHKDIAKDKPNLLTIIAPRHPDRAEEILHILSDADLSFAQRSKNEPIKADTSIYLADTMGEMGLFYQAAQIIFVAGSLTWGGHNPIEPGQLGRTIVYGSEMTNFKEISTDFLAADAAIQVAKPQNIAPTILSLMNDPARAAQLGNNALKLTQEKKNILQDIILALEPLLFQTDKRHEDT